MKNLFTQRKLLRLKKFDYSTPGYYFVTICAKGKIQYFGEIINKEMFLNTFGKIVENCWLQIPKHYKEVSLDEFKIMPNHVHGIVIIKPKSFVGNRHACSLQNKNFIHRRQNQLLPLVINSFKSSSSRLIHLAGLNSFQWQKSYYDHTIRNENSLQKIRQYIRYNHLKWETDIENPKNYLKTNDYYEKLFS